MIDLKKYLSFAAALLLSCAASASNNCNDEIIDDNSSQQEKPYPYIKVLPDEKPLVGVDENRAEVIAMSRKKWVNGTNLTYYFFDRNSDGEYVMDSNGNQIWRPWKGRASEENVVRAAFQTWKNLGIGLSFEEVSDRNNADIRIGFMFGDGAWSYVGRDILGIGRDRRTMNFGWVDEDTALHEIGHTLALKHEHQNPNAGIEWDEEKVYADLAKPPNNWDRDKTYRNIIKKYNIGSVEGSDWDNNSIMHYPFKAGLILKPVEYQTNPLIPAPGLSEGDKNWIRVFYPPLDEDESGDENSLAIGETALSLRNGESKNFSVKVNQDGRYRIETFGTLDTIITLFNSSGRTIASDDDSGFDYNAKIEPNLRAGLDYTLGVRLYYTNDSGNIGLRMTAL